MLTFQRLVFEREIGSNRAVTLRRSGRSTPWTRSRLADCFSGGDPLKHLCGNGARFSRETSIIPESVMITDWLHSLSLGVYKYFIAHMWHNLFE